MSLLSLSGVVRWSIRRDGFRLARAALARQCSQVSTTDKLEFEEPLPKLDICDGVKVSFSIFNNQCYVDIRRYFVNEEGRVLPTKRGIRINSRQWEVIKANQALIDTKLAELAKQPDAKENA